MRAVLQWIVSNSPLMVLALILATLAWVVALEEGDPTQEGHYGQAIPIMLSEPPEGMLIVGEYEDSVEFTLRAPRSVWSSLGVEHFTATVDLAGLGAGIHQVPVEWALNKQPSQVVLVDPEYITLRLEPEAEQTVPVRVKIEGEPQVGHDQRTPIVTPREVTVSGPATYVARVEEAVAQVSVDGASTDIKGEFRLQLLDSEGQSVPDVTLAPESVAVHIPIKRSAFYRPLVVKVVLTGTYASGYRITDISVDPPSVTIFGVPDVIDALPGYIETEPINLEGAQGDVVDRPTLKVPPNVSIVLDEQPVVRVAIEPIQSSLTVVITPTLQGLDPGFTSTVSPKTIELILSGPLPLLETLGGDDVRVVLDVFGLERGTHQIEPQIVVPEGLIAQSILPATVQVEIFIAPTPTATEPAAED